MSVQVVQVRGASTVTPVQLGDRQPAGGAPVITGVLRPAVLDDLTDVDGAGTAQPGATLVKGYDGRFHGAFPNATDWWSGDGPPPPVIPGASPGDFYFDRIGKGLYRLT